MSILEAKTPPKNPGVYLYKEESGTVIYVGKAKSLYHRVKSYFTAAKEAKVKQMVLKIADVEHFLTDNEIEALILENILIKKYKPKYNIRLRDDKNYQFIKIDYSLQIPQIYTVRRKDERLSSGKARYLGPYTSGL